MRFLLDTCVLSDGAKPAKFPHLAAWLEDQTVGQRPCSPEERVGGSVILGLSTRFLAKSLGDPGLSQSFVSHAQVSPQVEGLTGREVDIEA